MPGATTSHAGSRLICGLGNGPLGRTSRHAVGLRLIELLAAAHNRSWSLYPSIGAFVAIIRCPSQPAGQPMDPVYLLWPVLPYNVAGWSVAAAARRFGILAGRVTVVHDDLDTAVATLRWKNGGSAGGNNGVRSVISSLETDGFRRLRVGIGRPSEDRSRSSILAWVLGTLPPEDWERIAAEWAAPALQTSLLQPDEHERVETVSIAAAP